MWIFFTIIDLTMWITFQLSTLVWLVQTAPWLTFLIIAFIFSTICCCNSNGSRLSLIRWSHFLVSAGINSDSKIRWNGVLGTSNFVIASSWRWSTMMSIWSFIPSVTLSKSRVFNLSRSYFCSGKIRMSSFWFC